MRKFSGASASLLVLLLPLGGCGGGQVASTPAPTGGGSGPGSGGTPAPSAGTPTPSGGTPTPSGGTPTPSGGTPTPSGGTQVFATDVVSTRFTVQNNSNNEPVIREATPNAASLTVTYDAAERSYTLNAPDRISKFVPAERDPSSSAAFELWAKGTGLATEYLVVDHLQNVSGGFWQRHQASGANTAVDLDAFIYGTKTAASGVPASGTARYKVELSGVGGGLNDEVSSVAGTGYFEIDFGNGVFRTKGDTRSFNIAVDYWTGGSWGGSGVLSSSMNGFEGLLTVDTRNKPVFAALSGNFFGPGALELGATIRSFDYSPATFVGTFIGAQDGEVSDLPFAVVPNGRDRSYFGQEIGTGIFKFQGATSWDAGSFLSISRTIKLDFSADGAIALNLDPSSMSPTRATFTNADRLAAESTSAYSIYAKQVNGEPYRLVLSNPGPANSEIQLTYSSFGRLEVQRADDRLTGWTQIWFSYGVGYAGDRRSMGTGKYDGILRGAGGDLRDGSRYEVAGSSSFLVDFGAGTISGELRPVVTLVSGNTPIVIPEILSFTDVLSGSTFGFPVQLGPNSTGLDVEGQLFGPRAEEIAGQFSYSQRDSQGHPLNYIGGIFAAALKD